MMNMKKIVFFFLLLPFLACNKEKEVTKAVSIQIKGYNIGNSELEVTIDSAVYDKFKTLANKQIDFAKVFTYPSLRNEATLKIRDVVAGKEVYRQQIKLNTSELNRFYSFIYLNGSPLEIKPPASDPSTNKMAFYLHYPQSDDAIDVFLKNQAGKTAYIAKNIKPNQWAYADYVAAEDLKDATIYFTKAGTTDQWAFNSSEQFSKSPIGTMQLPKLGEKGLSCSYFATPSTNQLDVVRLFNR